MNLAIQPAPIVQPPPQVASARTDTVGEPLAGATIPKHASYAPKTLYASRKLPALVELVLRSYTDVSAGTRYTTSTLLNYVILGAGILIALSRLGLDWSKLQWLVAALGVGIGFGLQEVVANFICGLIVLFERSISVGDIITVGDQDGVVTKIRIRATTISEVDDGARLAVGYISHH